MISAPERGKGGGDEVKLSMDKALFISWLCVNK